MREKTVNTPSGTETYSLWNTLSNDCNGLDLGVLHELHGRAVDASGRSKIDDDVNVGVLGHGLVRLLVDGQQGLAGAPVHLANKLTAKSIDNTSNRRGLALADEVKVQHALDGTGLETIDKASGLVVEESVLRKRAQRSAGSSETLNMVIGREQALGAICAIIRRLSHGWT